MENSNKNQTNSQNGSNNGNINNNTNNNANNNAGNQQQKQNNIQTVPITPVQNISNIPNQPVPIIQAIPIVSVDKNIKDNKTVNQPTHVEKNEKVSPTESVSNEPKIKNNKLNIIMGVIILVLILIGTSYLSRSILDRQNKEREAKSDYSLNGITCYLNEKYFVIDRTDLSGDAGEDILVKSKMDNDEKLDCNYVVEEGDFELLNTNIGLSNSQYFSYLNDKLLILNQGTGVRRDFIIYDLEKKEKVYSDSYHSSLFDLKDGILTYWHMTNDIPNKENCSRIDEYNKIAGAQIQGKIVLNLSDLNDKNYTEFRCIQAE